MGIGIKRLMEMSRIMEMMTNHDILERSNCVVSGCLLYRDKRMIDNNEKFIYAILIFATIYIGLHVMLAYLGGRL